MGIWDLGEEDKAQCTGKKIKIQMLNFQRNKILFYRARGNLPFGLENTHPESPREKSGTHCPGGDSSRINIQRHRPKIIKPLGKT